ncbi:hypothetical protein BU23DRAFT_563287 [Bimuria novae-zelandiae CBS 107.79]|uniref:Uncharacterized protein n=1 Tax=Bimuria novae-zelandiae CBS 107.79 TaxID=1447943 RepID=A0A6A5VTL9_9PLEO|nr:hypothetical protein BU23DRAFT_563287 [Bimuria novae-zelandiae CBS 107.79]
MTLDIPSRRAGPFPARAPNPCYRQAYYRKPSGEITEADYFRAIFKHLVKDGVHHGADWCIQNELEDVDPLGFSLNCWITYEDENKKPEDSKPYEDVFAAYRKGNMNEIQAALGRLSEGHARHMCKSLALLALQERNAEVLGRLLDDGIEIEEPFEDEVRRVQRKLHPQTYGLLVEYAAKELKRPWAATKRPRQEHPLDWGK